MGWFDFAPTQTNNVRPLQIGLCVLDVAELPPPEPKVAEDEPPQPKPDAKDPFLDQMKVEVVEEAWVLLFPAPASAKTVILCRTTKRGQLVKIERGEVDGVVPEGDKRRFVFVNEGATYLCYWSYNNPLFKLALADVETNLAKARRRHPFFDFVARPWKREKVFDGEFDDSTPARQHDHDKLSFLFHNLGTTGHGYMSFNQLVEANQDPRSPYLTVSAALFKGKLSTQCWVFARRNPICTTYLAEFVSRRAVHLRAQSAWHYAQFHTAMSFIDAAKQARRVEELDKQLRAGLSYFSREIPQSTEALEYAEQYWYFAWQCATTPGENGTRIERSLFEKSVNVIVTSDDWKKAAYEIAEKIYVAHPAYTTRDGSRIDNEIHYKFIAHSAPLLAYFDIYRFGAEQAERPWVNHLGEAEATIDTALASVVGKLRTDFAQAGSYLALLQDIAAHVKDDDVRQMMQKRYLDSREDGGLDFWSTLPEFLGEGGQKNDETGKLDVERPDPLLDIKPYIDLAFVSSAKQGELFKEFFEHRGHALAHRISAARKDFDELFSKMINLDEKILKSKVETIKREDIHLEPDFEGRRSRGACSSVVRPERAW